MCVDPKPRPTHEQVEGEVKAHWRTEPGHVEKCLGDLWVAEKFQTGTIAGSLEIASKLASMLKSLGGRALFG